MPQTCQFLKKSIADENRHLTFDTEDKSIRLLFISLRMSTCSCISTQTLLSSRNSGKTWTVAMATLYLTTSWICKRMVCNFSTSASMVNNESSRSLIIFLKGAKENNDGPTNREKILIRYSLQTKFDLSCVYQQTFEFFEFSWR